MASSLQKEGPELGPWSQIISNFPPFLVSLQSWCCLPPPAPLHFPQTFGDLVASYNLPLPQLHQGVGVVEIQYPLVCVIIPESTSLFKNTICY